MSPAVQIYSTGVAEAKSGVKCPCVGLLVTPPAGPTLPTDQPSSRGSREIAAASLGFDAHNGTQLPKAAPQDGLAGASVIFEPIMRV